MKPRDVACFTTYALPENPWEFERIEALDIRLMLGMVTRVLFELLAHPQDAGENLVLTEVPGLRVIVSAMRDEPLPRVVIYCNKFAPEGILWVPQDIVRESWQRARVLSGVIDR